jgi:hypothetical protein
VRAQLRLLTLETTRLLDGRWPGVVAIAQALLQRGTLTFDEARECYGPALVLAAKARPLVRPPKLSPALMRAAKVQLSRIAREQ